MRKMILATAATLSLVSGSALAADLSYPTKAPAYVAPIQNYDWSGFYIGVMGGGGWGRSRQTDTAGTTTGFYDVSGGFIGGTLGYNIQTRPWVWGIEGDGAWARIRGTVATHLRRRHLPHEPELARHRSWPRGLGCWSDHAVHHRWWCIR